MNAWLCATSRNWDWVTGTGAFDSGGRILGTLRIARAGSPSLVDPEMYAWDEIERERPGSVCHGSKLVVARDARGSRIAFALMRRATIEALRRGFRYLFLECFPSLVGLYARIGFVEVRKTVDRLFGSVSILRWDMLDLQHLERIGSPLRLIVVMEAERMGRAGANMT